MKRWGRPIPERLAHLAAAADSPARQEAATLVARSEALTARVS
jgi:lipoyl synthase